MLPRNVSAEILDYLRQAAAGPEARATAGVIAGHLKVSRRTVNRVLADLVTNGRIERTGVGPATGYRSTTAPKRASSEESVPVIRSAEAEALLAQLSRPLKFPGRSI